MSSWRRTTASSLAELLVNQREPTKRAFVRQALVDNLLRPLERMVGRKPARGHCPCDQVVRSKSGSTRGHAGSERTVNAWNLKGAKYHTKAGYKCLSPDCPRNCILGFGKSSRVLSANLILCLDRSNSI